MTLETLKTNLVALNRVARELRSRESSQVRDTDKLVQRVASRWVLAASGSMRKEYDIMLRLQVLEGVAGVDDVWWRKGRRGLPQAQAAFEGYPKVDPSWFSPDDSRMYGAVETTLAKTISSMKLPLEPDELINLTLLGQSLTENEAIGSIPRGVGKSAKSGILEGKETPVKIGLGPISFWMKKKLITVKVKKKRLTVSPHEDAEGRVLDIPSDTRAQFETPQEFLSDIVFHSWGDPLGKKIRGLMRKTWTTDKVWSEIMLYWLDQIEKGRFLQGKQLADIAQVAPGSFSQNYWKGAWAAFFSSLWSNRGLLKELQGRLREQGLDDEIQRPDLSKVKKGDPLSIILPRNRGRKRARQGIVGRVFARWIHRGTVKQNP